MESHSDEDTCEVADVRVPFCKSLAHCSTLVPFSKLTVDLESSLASHAVNADILPYTVTLLDDLRLFKNIVFILLTELKNLQQVNYDCEPMLAGPAPVGLRIKVFCAEW